MKELIINDIIKIGCDSMYDIKTLLKKSDQALPTKNTSHDKKRC